MKTRIIVAAVAIPLLLIVIFLLEPWAFGILLGVVSAIAGLEFLIATKAGENIRMVIYVVVSAFLIPLLQSFSALSIGSIPVGGFPVGSIFVALLLLLILFGEGLIAYDTERAIPFAQIGLLFFAGAIIPLFLGTLATLRAIEYGYVGATRFFDGRAYVLIPIVIAFASDTGAYFAGMAFGKHKLLEKVSPNKTIEGSLGGFAAAVVVMLTFCLIMITGFEAEFNLLAVALYAVLGSAVAQLGDLAFSMIKREFGKKDFGSLIPGHGGMLDRFDSMIVLAPLIYTLVFWFPPWHLG